MNLHPLDLTIIFVYLALMAMIGFIIKNRATQKIDSYFLADRNVPWWMLGLAGCSSYIDIGGTMSMVGAPRDAEAPRVSAAVFLLVLMIFNLMFIAVGTGKFAEEFLPFSRWESTLIVFAVVGVYVILGGFFGVILTDIFQTSLIAVGAIVLTFMVFRVGIPDAFLAQKDAAWGSLAPTWHLWPSFMPSTAPSYQHFFPL